MGVALLALTALCPISHATEAESAGQANWLGVSVTRLSSDYRERTDYRADGLLVTGVTPGSLADQAGIARGDVLVVVGSVSLRRVDDLARAELQLESGNPISVVVARDGGRMIKIMNLEPPPVPTPTFDDAQARTPEQATEPAPTAQDQAVAPEAKAAPAPQKTASALQPVQPSPGPALLGLRGEALNPDFAAALGVPGNRGVVVLDVANGSAAQAAGIRPGDVITRVDDQKVESIQQLERALAASPGRVSFVVQRQGSESVVDVGPQAAVDSNPLPAPKASASVSPAPEAPSTAVESRDDSWRDRMLLELRSEVRLLRRELKRLRDELDRMKTE